MFNAFIFFIFITVLLVSGFAATKNLQDIIIEAFGFRVQLNSLFALLSLLFITFILSLFLKILFFLVKIPSLYRDKKKTKNLEKLNNMLIQLLLNKAAARDKAVKADIDSLLHIDLPPYFKEFLAYHNSSSSQSFSEEKASLNKLLLYPETQYFALSTLATLMIEEGLYHNAGIYASKLFEIYPETQSLETLIKTLVLLERWQQLASLLDEPVNSKLLTKTALKSYRTTINEKQQSNLISPL